MLFVLEVFWLETILVHEGTERTYHSSCLYHSLFEQVWDSSKSEVMATLENAGLPANEDNAIAMKSFLNAVSEESSILQHFRNFMLLLPSDQLQEVPQFNCIIRCFSSCLRSMACIVLRKRKCKVQPLSSPKLCQGLYRGSTPAMSGQFSRFSSTICVAAICVLSCSNKLAFWHCMSKISACAFASSAWSSLTCFCRWQIVPVQP